MTAKAPEKRQQSAPVYASAHTTTGSSAAQLLAQESSGANLSGYKVATLPTPSTRTRAMKAVVIWWRVEPVRSPGMIIGAMDFACRSVSLVWLSGMGI